MTINIENDKETGNKHPEFSEKVKFHPFIGENYWLQNKRVLLLGESHYGKINEDTYNTGFTDRTVKRYGIAAPVHFFRRIIEVYFGDSSQIAEKYKKVSFYNFVQHIMLESEGTPRPRPTKSEFANSIEPFIEVVRQLKPDIIICYGMETYYQIPEDFGGYAMVEKKYYPSKNENKMKTKKIGISVYKGEKAVTIIGVYHPTGSWGFNSMHLHRFLKELNII